MNDKIKREAAVVMPEIIKGLNKLTEDGYAPALVYDDNGHWCFSDDGAGSCRFNDTDDLSINVFCEAGWFELTIEAAWENYMRRIEQEA